MTVLFGRDDEIRSLERLIHNTVGGRSGSVVVVAPAGLGKSALLRRCGALAADHGVRTLEMTGFETEAHIGFAGLTGLLRPLRPLIDTLDVRSRQALRAALAIDDADGLAPFAVYPAVLDLLAAGGDREPLLCLIDDLQWVDRGSADALTFAMRRLRDDRVGFVVASREDPPRFGDDRVLRLGPLSAAAAAELVRSRRPGASDEALTAIVDAAAGVPLDLVQLASNDDRRPVEASSFRERVAGLGGDALLGALIVALHPTGEADVIERAADATGLGEAEIAAAEGAGLVERNATTVTVTHPLARSAVVAASSAALRRRAHRALAGALGDQASDATIWHLAAAAPGKDDQIAEELLAIGERCAGRGDQALASQAFEVGSTLTTDPTQRVAMLTRAGVAAALGGLPEGPLLDRALALAGDTPVADEIRMLRCLAASWRGDHGTAPHVADEHGPHMAARSPSIARVVYSCASGAAFQCDDYMLMSRFARRAEALDDGSPISGLLLLAEVNTGFNAVVHGDLARGSRILHECAALLAAGEATEIATPCAYALMFAGLHDEAATLIDAALGRARQQGELATVAWLLAADARLAADRGDIDRAESSADEACELATFTGGRFAEATARAQLCWVAAVTGRRDLLDANVRGAMAVPHAAALARHAIGLYEFATGDVQAAAVELELAMRPAMEYPGVVLTVIPAAGDLAEAYARDRRDDAFEAVAGRVRLAAGEAPGPWLSMIDTRLRLFRATAGDLDEVISAADGCAGRQPSMFERARTALVIGERLRRARRRADARRWLQLAADQFAACQAVPWHARAVAELGICGFPPNAAGIRTGLTAQEHRVMVAVAGGASNEQAARELFLSPRTVEGHLTRIFRKTGVRSRTELVRLFLEQGAQRVPS